MRSQSNFQRYLELAGEGNPSIQLELAVYYLGGREGSGFPQNFTEARRWFLAATTSGDAKIRGMAQCFLGQMYKDGQGCSVDYHEARRWLRLAVARDDNGAQRILDTMDRNGQGLSDEEKRQL